ncbi:hypothetical protein BWQ96_05168 [Gracilariopsis chorda]|uniref:VTT domain-containing protein n=1 Tax=Gracilariopsis chorda TaxID=448386 RepID=A0A2V3ISG6_9FLOR|nr:hypothetical protein BWQ96_05168 [Gracilariopsis chorda]|eukprot:PXF45066.1 hypothetical protein BWQ96_05168 [Gracilariopsis chorda]
MGSKRPGQPSSADYGATQTSPPSQRPPHPSPPTSSLSPRQPTPPDPPPPQPPSDPKSVVTLSLLLIFLASSGVAAATGFIRPDAFVHIAQWFERLGPQAAYLYGLLYFVLELVAVPAIPLTLGSGYLFGMLRGTITVSVASTLAATASFLIARYGLRDNITRLAERYPRFRLLDRAIGREGFKFVLLLRLSPLLPFAISNYLYGLTSVNILEYVLGSWLGMLPGTLAYVSAGATVNNLTDLSSNRSNISPVLLLIGVVAAIAVLASVGKIASEAIENSDEGELQNH